MAQIAEEIVIKLAINPTIRPVLFALAHDRESCAFVLPGEAEVLIASWEEAAAVVVVVVLGASTTMGISVTPQESTRDICKFNLGSYRGNEREFHLLDLLKTKMRARGRPEQGTHMTGFVSST